VAQRHEEYIAFGAIVVGVSIDPVGANAAMVDKLKLRFPLLSDPDRSVAIVPYGVADERDPRNIAIPTTVVIAPDGSEVWRRASFDFAERPEEDEVLEVVRSMGWPSTTQSPPAPGTPDPGPKAMPFSSLSAYFRGAKFAAIAMSRRFPEAKENAKAYAAQMDRYIDAVHVVRDST
jgi:hypothetical protein